MYLARLLFSSLICSLIFSFFCSNTFAQDSFYTTTVQSSIDNSLGDVEENLAGEIYANSSDLELIDDGGEQIVGLRFNNIGLPQGAQIEQAYIQFSVDELNSSFCQLDIRIEMEDQAEAFQLNSQNLSNRSLSASSVQWRVAAWNREFEQGPSQRSPDLKSLVQEVVDRNAWQNGNSLAFLISGTGKRTAISFDRDPNFAPQLIIEARIPIPTTPLSDIYINELMASSSRVFDDQGEPEDWVEIYNGGNQTQNIGGIYLTDDLSNLRKWQLLAPVEIAPNSHAILWLDGEPEQGNTHASFKLDKDGEELAIVQVLNDEEIILDHIVFPELELNVSYGRQNDGGENWIKFSEYSPAASNNGKGRFLDASVSFSQEGGFYSGPLSISMQTSDPDTRIFYSFNGLEPDTNAFLYSGPVQLDRTQLLRARAFKTGFAGGEVRSETYFINERHNLPVLNIQTEPENLFDRRDGIYVSGNNGVPGFCSNEPRNWNQSWERPIHLSLYENDGSEAFSVNAGIKIGGGCSRGMKMKPLNFYFRGSLYGDAKVEYQVFPQLDIQEFNRLKIRNSGNDFVQMGFRDGALQSILFNTIDIDMMAYRPVVTYINGTYWGIYGLRELYNEDYVGSHHEVDKENLDIISNPYAGGEFHEGDRLAFAQIQAFIENNDMSNPANYELVKEQVDINEFLNYHIVQIYLANYDWPANNLRVWRERKEEGKWRWMLYDLDASSGFASWSQSTVTHNTLAFATAINGNWWPNGPHSTLWLRKLFENPEFRNEFIQRSSTYADLIFNSNRVNRITDSLKAMISPEVNRHLERWTNRFWEWGGGQPMGGSRASWEGYIQTFKNFFRGRPAQMRGHIRGKFALDWTYELRFNFQRTTPGSIYLHSNETKIPPQFVSQYFPDVPLKVKAVPDPGYIFLRWEESGETNPEIEILGSDVGTLTPIFVPQQPSISEIHYNPQEGQAYEFIELYNPGTIELDLGGYRFVEGIEFSFPAGIKLAPENFLLIAKDKNKYASLSCEVLQWDSGDLDDVGESLSLALPGGEIIDKISYSNAAPWPREANGGGASLSLKKPYLENGIPENWEAYFAQGGSPCGEVSPVLGQSGSQDFSVKVYPNPASDEIKIEYTNIAVEPLPMEIFNLFGQKVGDYSLESTPFQQIRKISVQNLSSGTYILRFGNESRGIEQNLLLKQ